MRHISTDGIVITALATTVISLFHYYALENTNYSSSEKGLNKSVIAGILGGIKEKLQEKTSDDEHEDSL